MVELKEEQAGAVAVLQVKGRIDSTTASLLGERLTTMLNEGKAQVVVDFSLLDYISSAGFRVLLLAAKRAEQTASRMVLCGVSGKVRQLFDLGGFLDLFTIEPSREQGVAALS